jgi:hypothetical protein
MERIQPGDHASRHGGRCKGYIHTRAITPGLFGYRSAVFGPSVQER